MFWIELMCDGCNDNPWGERYRKGSVNRLKTNAKADGWKTIKGKLYCPKCQQRLKAKRLKANKE